MLLCLEIKKTNCRICFIVNFLRPARRQQCIEANRIVHLSLLHICLKIVAYVYLFLEWHLIKKKKLNEIKTIMHNEFLLLSCSESKHQIGCYEVHCYASAIAIL
ncbi:hypothetical protein XELAEV_18021075mg [Xenopus laevis]|uniref:Uncharacterized protein n=1 Tax=Xenopus laevis TaxID=8355 RepID=A0A974DAR1_XENLA|nr:hypothetical protein XELAEV_18021075mg [Xenopus laevis]